MATPAGMPEEGKRAGKFARAFRASCKKLNLSTHSAMILLKISPGRFYAWDKGKSRPSQFSALQIEKFFKWPEGRVAELLGAPPLMGARKYLDMIERHVAGHRAGRKRPKRRRKKATVTPIDRKRKKAAPRKKRRRVSA